MSKLAIAMRSCAAAGAIVITASLVAVTPAVAAPLIALPTGPFSTVVRVSLVPLNVKVCVGHAGAGLKIGPYGRLKLTRC